MRPVGHALGALALETADVSLKQFGRGVVQMQDVTDHPIEELPVMGHNNERALVLAQPFFKP